MKIREVATLLFLCKIRQREQKRPSEHDIIKEMKNKDHTVIKCVDWPYTKNFILYKILPNLICKILFFEICFLVHIP